jgi:hypothetical protein
MDPRAEIALAFLEYCGAETAQKFVKALRSTSRDRGRLVYWQEALWTDFALAKQMDLPSSLEEVSSILSHLPDPNAPSPRTTRIRSGSFTLEDIAEALDENDAGVREEAARALAERADPASLQLVLNALHDPCPDVQGHLFETIGLIGDPSHIPLLHQLSLGPDWLMDLAGSVVAQLEVTAAIKRGGAPALRDWRSTHRGWGVELRRADLGGLDLSGADLQDARAGAVNLRHACLTGADLSRAHLWGADLRYADLSQATLAGASLYRATLDGALLPDADFTDADLEECSLMDVDLTSTRGLRRAQLGEAQLGPDTRLPAALD